MSRGGRRTWVGLTFPSTRARSPPWPCESRPPSAVPSCREAHRAPPGACRPSRPFRTRPRQHAIAGALSPPRPSAPTRPPLGTCSTSNRHRPHPFETRPWGERVSCQPCQLHDQQLTIGRARSGERLTMETRVVGMLSLLAALSAAAQPAITTAPATADRNEIPVTLILSGGVSLGSYEAGLSWAVTRLTQVRPGHAPEPRSGRVRLVAVTGGVRRQHQRRAQRDIVVRGSSLPHGYLRRQQPAAQYLDPDRAGPPSSRRRCPIPAGRCVVVEPTSR